MTRTSLGTISGSSSATLRARRWRRSCCSACGKIREDTRRPTTTRTCGAALTPVQTMATATAQATVQPIGLRRALGGAGIPGAAAGPQFAAMASPCASVAAAAAASTTQAAIHSAMRTGSSSGQWVSSCRVRQGRVRWRERLNVATTRLDRSWPRSRADLAQYAVG